MFKFFWFANHLISTDEDTNVLISHLINKGKTLDNIKALKIRKSLYI